jgi:hypothetical protein
MTAPDFARFWSVVAIAGRPERRPATPAVRPVPPPPLRDSRRTIGRGKRESAYAHLCPECKTPVGWQAERCWDCNARRFAPRVAVAAAVPRRGRPRG